MLINIEGQLTPNDSPKLFYVLHLTMDLEFAYSSNSATYDFLLTVICGFNFNDCFVCCKKKTGDTSFVIAYQLFEANGQVEVPYAENTCTNIFGDSKTRNRIRESEK